MTRNVMANNRAVFTFRKAKNSLREAYGNPIFGLVYPIGVKEFAYFGWAMNNMHAQSNWMIAGALGAKAGQHYIGWKDNMDHMAASSAADIAILMPLQSRDWGSVMITTTESLGMGQALADKNISHVFLIEPSLKIEKLKQYKLLILGSSCCLSDAQIEVILEYVQNGGTVYASGHAGTQNEYGELRENWKLGQAIGLAGSTSTSFYPEGCELSSVSTGHKVTFPSRVRKFRLEDNTRSKTLITIHSSKGEVFPAVIKSKYGKGFFVYSAPQFGAVNYERETTVGREWKYIFNKETDAMFETVFEEASPLDSKFIPVSIPEKIFTTVYKQDKNNKNYSLIHLLNATGVNNKYGKFIPYTPTDTPWPDINEDIVFDLKTAGVKAAYIVSPDYNKKYNVKAIKGKDGYYRITVPAGYLKKYAIVYVEETSKE
jgi:hypothetical protein